MPVVLPVGDALGLRLHRLLASHTLLERGVKGVKGLRALTPYGPCVCASSSWPSQTHHSMALHVAGLADRLVVLHDVGLPGQHAVTVKAAEVLQVPVLSLRLCVLITEDELRNTHTHTHRHTHTHTVKTEYCVFSTESKGRWDI